MIDITISYLLVLINFNNQISIQSNLKVFSEIMTMSDVADLRKHNYHLIMSFVIQAIVNIRKEIHLIIFLWT